MPIPKALKWTLIGSMIVVPVGGYVAWKALSGAVLGDVAGAEAALESERAAAIAEGLPAEPDTFFRNLAMANQVGNSAPALAVELKNIYVATPSDQPVQKAILEEGTSADIGKPNPLVQAHLRKLDASLNRLGELAKAPNCYFVKDWSQGALVEFPEMLWLKGAVHVLTARAIERTRGGHFAQAGDDLSTAFRLSQIAERQGTLIGFLVRIAVSQIAFHRLRRILRLTGSEPKARDAMRRALHVAHAPPDVAFGLKGEIAGAIAVLRTFQSVRQLESFAGEPIRDVKPDFFVPRMKKAWEARYIQFWRRVWPILPLDKHDYVAIGDILQREADKEERRKTLDYIGNRILLPFFHGAMLSAARERSQYELCRAMLDLLEFKRRNGSFPTALRSLGQPYTDYLDGKPLRYERRGNGFRLYSIDKDRVDNGGAKRTPNMPNDAPHDLVVEYP